MIDLYKIVQITIAGWKTCSLGMSRLIDNILRPRFVLTFDGDVRESTFRRLSNEFTSQIERHWSILGHLRLLGQGRFDWCLNNIYRCGNSEHGGSESDYGWRRRGNNGGFRLCSTTRLVLSRSHIDRKGEIARSTRIVAVNYRWRQFRFD